MDEQKLRQEQWTVGEACEDVVNDAIAKVPKDHAIVGIQVVVAYVGPSIEPNAVEAVGALVSRAQYPMAAITRLFHEYTAQLAGAWQRHPDPPHNGAGRLLPVRGPRRRPRR
jgi:hypothetical protein